MKRFLICTFIVLLLIPTVAFSSHAVLTKAVNHLAPACELVKAGYPGRDVTFTDADFRQALGVTTYPAITILSLPDPADGVLKLDRLRVSAGQVIPRASIERLVFSPSSDRVLETSFTFRAGNLSGGAALTCKIRFVMRENQAPTVTGGSAVSVFSTPKNASLWGTMASYDPDGDEVTYLIVKYPTHGTLEITDTTSGAFRYTPRSGFSGRDKFSYVVRDAYGSYSTIGQVDIKVDKHARDFTITDMTDSAAGYAAIRMVSANIMQAEYNGYAVYFHPSGSMTRAEFLVAAMKACGNMPKEETVWLYDDLNAIPTSARPYILTATAAGVVKPTWEGGLYFRPDEQVTCRDALAWLTALCGECPAEIEGVDEDAALTRKDAAYLLWMASMT